MSDPTTAPEEKLSTQPTEAEGDTPPTLSKNAQKRLKRAALMEAGREEWKAKKKQGDKERKAKKRAAIEAGLIDPPARTKFRPNYQVKTGVRAILDLSFPEDYMLPNEVSSLCAQIARCHSTNGFSTHPIPLTVTGFEGPVKARLPQIYPGYERWCSVRWAEAAYTPGEDTVYLSADSEHVLEKLEAGTTYIIGGLVDRNRHKGVCHEKAVEQKIRHARLPIGEYMQLAHRRILAVNHVFEIMVKFQETGDWGKAFDHVIPARKREKGEDEGDAAAAAAAAEVKPAEPADRSAE